jgi:rhodanese-related sulfurtransferase
MEAATVRERFLQKGVPTMTATITIPELRSQNAGGLGVQLVDVRSASEFAAGHIPRAANIPMDQIEARLADLDQQAPIVLVCQSGRRATVTAGLLAPHGLDVSVLEGGTQAWTQAGLPVITATRTRWSLERQARLIAGLLVLTGVLLATLVDPAWVYLAGVVGLGLTFAGATDVCLMGIVLAKMPWNRA